MAIVNEGRSPSVENGSSKARQMGSEGRAVSPIAIIDYGMGNLRSVQKAFEKVGCNAIITSDAGEIQQASKIVLPGVGAFGACMENLEKFGLV